MEETEAILAAQDTAESTAEIVTEDGTSLDAASTDTEETMIAYGSPEAQNPETGVGLVTAGVIVAGALVVLCIVFTVIAQISKNKKSGKK